MKPKEKAKELIHFYTKELLSAKYSINGFVIEQLAKQCAIIAVEEILKNNCGAKNKKGEKYIFDADHIYPFSKIIDDFNITSIEEAISCEKLWDIDNGRTLCRDCHKKTDTWGINPIKNA